MFTAVPEWTVAAIAAEEIEGLEGIDAAWYRSCLLCSAKRGLHGRCAPECRQWIYVNLLVISFCQGQVLWAWKMPKPLEFCQNHTNYPSLHHTPQTSVMISLFTLNLSFRVSVEIISVPLLSYQSEIWFPTLSTHNQNAWVLGPL